MLVVDASLVVAALVDSGPDGEWASRQIARESLAAPHQLMVEVANILARAARSRQISAEIAELAHADLLELQVELFAYELVGNRAWELHSTVTAYDAWYVALAEQLDAPLGTLDRKLSRASGPRCKFKLPPRSRA